MRNEHREGQLNTLRSRAVDAVLYRISQLLEAVQIQVQHRQSELGFPQVKISKEMEAEAESLVSSLVEAVQDDLHGWVRMAIAEVDENEIVGVDIEGMEDEVRVRVLESL